MANNPQQVVSGREEAMAVVLSHECALKVLLNNRHLARTIRCPLPETNGFSKTDLREIQTQLGLKDPQTEE